MAFGVARSSMYTHVARSQDPALASSPITNQPVSALLRAISAKMRLIQPSKNQLSFRTRSGMLTFGALGSEHRACLRGHVAHVRHAPSEKGRVHHRMQERVE